MIFLYDSTCFFVTIMGSINLISQFPGYVFVALSYNASIFYRSTHVTNVVELNLLYKPALVFLTQYRQCSPSRAYAPRSGNDIRGLENKKKLKINSEIEIKIGKK